VPLVQGTLRYAYKVGHVPAQQNAKNAAEGSTFAAALLPMVHYCHAASATTVENNMKFGLTFDTNGANPTGTLPDFAAVKGALEAVYPCLGITCAHVGALGQVTSDDLIDATIGAKCTDPTSSHVAWTPMPSTKITGDAKHHVKIEVKAEGAVSDYDAAKKADLESKMATVAEVDVNAVTVTVTEATSRRRQLQAGSVILSFVIVTADAAAATAAKDKATTALADTTKASAALGVTVTEVPTVTVGSETAAAADDDDDGLSGGAIAGIAIGAVVGLLCIGAIIFFAMKSGKNVDPK
jgi:hypothetical protein